MGMSRFINPTILVDIDHTLSDAGWRDSMMGNWDEYHGSAHADQPIMDMVLLINSLHDQRWNIVGLTTRPEKFRQQTLRWLMQYNVKMDEVLMRADDDFRPSAISKVALAHERFPDFANEVMLVFDDRDDIVAAFKAQGVTVLQVHARRS
jgi:hypothetical protein